jgi:hypothetical protein
MADVMINDSSLGRPSIRSDYSRGNFPALASSQESRRLVKLNPVSGSSFTSGQQIRFNIPAGADEVWDPVNSFLEFTVASNTTDQPLIKEVGSVGAFARATVRNGGNVLEDKQNLPHLGHFLALTSDPSDLAERYLQQGQLYDRASRNKDWNDTGDMFLRGAQKMIWPMSEIGVFATYQYLPLMYMGASGIAVELILEVARADDFFKKKNASNATASTTLTVSNCVMYLELVKMRKSWVSAGWEHIASRQNIEIPLSIWECQQQAVTTATNQVVRFTSFAQSMKAMVSVIKLTSLISSSTADEFLVFYDELPLESYQYRLNVDLFPQEPIVTYDTGVTGQTGASRVAAEFLKVFRQFADYTRGCVIFGRGDLNKYPWIKYTSETSTTTLKLGANFVLPIALDVHLLGEEDNMVSGLNLRDKAAPLEILLKFHTAPSAATLFLMMLKDAKLVINEAGCVVYD